MATESFFNMVEATKIPPATATMPALALASAFDRGFYLGHSPDVAKAGVDPFAHYITEGWREGRDPSPDFSTRWYHALVPDLAEPGLQHWLREGRTAGLPTRPPQVGVALPMADLAALLRAFDSAFYLGHSPDVAKAGADPFSHYMTEGWREGRDPSPDFSTRWYHALVPDLAEPGLWHWLREGRALGLPTRPPQVGVALPMADLAALLRAFDPAFYLGHSPDIAAAGVDPFSHYMTEGWREGRDPSPDFSTRWYHALVPDLSEPGLQHWLREGRTAGLPTRPPQVGVALPMADLAALLRAFDRGFYLGHSPDIAAAGVDPFSHYMTEGWREGRDPSPDFSTRWYHALVPDLSEPGLQHWLREGRTAGLPTRPPQVGVALPMADLAALLRAFDPAFYLGHSPDIAAAGVDPFAHYMTEGWREGRDPSPDFSTRWYHALVPDLAEPGLQHWLREGRTAGLPTRPPQVGVALPMADLAALLRAFDPVFYLGHSQDVAKVGVDPFSHYMTEGWREGRDPSPDFSTRWYHALVPDLAEPGLQHWLREGRTAGLPPRPPEQDLGLSPTELVALVQAFDAPFYCSTNPDVVAAGVDPFAHYMSDGWREGRDPSPDFSTRWYLAQNSDIAEARLNPFWHWVFHGQTERRPGRPMPPTAPELGPGPLIDESRINWAAADPAEIEAIRAWFDPAFYIAQHPDVGERGIDPATHYLMAGWMLGFDPSPDFSTRYYLDCYPDIARAGHNPFVHWCRRGRHELRETRSYIDMARRDFRPKVSVIVPNYKHAAYLPQRLRSIAEQSYNNLEIIILDDCSPDNSREVIRQTVAELGMDARLEFNEVNSGNVFAQWQKGMTLATGDLIWICESDDYCAPDFLEHLVPAFADQAVNIAFGRIQFCDAEGKFMEGLDGYREGAEPGIWSRTVSRPAAQWFNGGFGVNNVIANVGGCLFRRMELPQQIWDTARSYRICGDWYLYIQIAGSGKITYEPRSVAYFRQHGANTSASNFHKPYYYDENRRILTELVRHWGIADATRENFLGKVQAQYRHFGLEGNHGSFDDLMQRDSLMAAKREQPHIQLHFLGFHVGGGELFPINLANAFAAAGMTVSMMAVDLLQQNPDMRKKLNPRIPVYHVHDMTRAGRGTFLGNAGVSLINSHVASSDAFLASLDAAPLEVPFVVTLHGSYVGLEDAPAQVVDWILNNVDQFIYTADRNLEFFESRDAEWDSFVKLPNAMPIDTRPARFGRADLGISDTDTVFTMVARGIKRKGWRAAVEAFRTLRETHGRRDTHLLLIGEGTSTDEARALAEGVDGVHFLGYQSEINGILRLSDCLLLPTRFQGESYPLCLIQAIQEHIPAIATDIGEIRSMMTTETGDVAGILLENQRDSGAYFAALAQSMAAFCDPNLRAGFAATAAARAQIFDMDRLVVAYREIFEKVTILRRR